MVKVYLGSDHRGVVLKQVIITYLKSTGHQSIDLGCHTEEMVNYPKFAKLVCRAVVENQKQTLDTIGILICHTANGMAIAANRHKDIRAALAYNSQVAGFAKQHNNANVICLPAGYLTNNEALEIIDVFLSSHFQGGRHAERIAGIDNDEYQYQDQHLSNR